MTPFSFDRVVVFGASHLQSFGGAPWTQYLSNEYGLTVAFQNEGVGGNTAVNGAARVDAVVAGIPEGETAVFIVHFGGNGLQQIFQDLPNARSDYITAMTYIYNAITSAGHICLFCSISFRQFGTPTNSAGDWTGGNSYDDPELYGADFVNSAVLHPLIASLDPELLNTDGRAIIDLHNYSYNSGPLLLGSDGNHWLESVAPQRWMCDVLHSLSTTGETPVIPRVADPRTREYLPEKLHINFLNPPSGPDCYIRGLNNMPINPMRLVLLEPDNEISGLVLSLVNELPGATGNNGIGVATDRGLPYLSGAQTASYHRIDAGGSRTYTISGLRPGALVTVKIASSRASNNGTWLTRVTLNGVSLPDQNTGSTTVINVFEETVEIGESGQLVILVECPSGFAFINSAELDIEYPGPAHSQSTKNVVPLNWALKPLSAQIAGHASGLAHSAYPDGYETEIILPPDPGSVGAWYEPYDEQYPYINTPAGFTSWPSMTGYKQIWLSDVHGNDSNSGLAESAPKKTLLAALQQTQTGVPCVIWQRCGESAVWDWRGGSFPTQMPDALRGGESESRPTIISWYGSGARPKNYMPQQFTRDWHNNLRFIGLNWVSDRDSYRGTLWLNRGKNIVYEDCRFDNTELVIQGTAHDLANSPENFKIRRNIFNGAHWFGSSFGDNSKPSSVFMSHTKDLVIEENVFYRSGWSPEFAETGANTFNHAMYTNRNSFGTSLRVRNNLIFEPSSLGLHMRYGGICEDNHVFAAAVGLSMGYHLQEPADDGIEFVMRNNVVDYSRPTHRFLGSCQNGMCTPAQWHFIATVNNINASWRWYNNIAQRRSMPNVVSPEGLSNPPWIGGGGNYQISDYHLSNQVNMNNYEVLYGETGTSKEFNNLSWHVTSETQGDNINYLDPGRTFTKYMSFLKGEPLDYSTDCIPALINRGKYQFNPMLRAIALNAYIREGYQIV